VKYFLIPYIVLNVIVIIELAAIIYVTTKDSSKIIKETKSKKNRKRETFNGFYVDR